MGVCVEPMQYILGLREFEHWVWRTQPEGRSNGPGDLDLTIYGLRKYCRLSTSWPTHTDVHGLARASRARSTRPVQGMRGERLTNAAHMKV
jgi:hypothetical protein